MTTMTTTERDALVAETKDLIAEVEGGDTAHAAWIAIQDRVQRLYEWAGTERETAEMLDRNKSWVNGVLRWDRRGSAPPFGGKDANAARYERNERTVGRRVLTDPDKRRAAIESLAKDDPAAVAELAKAAIDATDDATSVDGIASDAFAKSNEIRQGGKAKGKTKRRTGALDGYLRAGSRISTATFQGKKALDDIRSVDEPLPDDLRDGLLGKLDTMQTTWDLVRAALNGESLGDQAEDFLASLETD